MKSMERGLKNFMRERRHPGNGQQLARGEWRPVLLYPDTVSPERLAVGVIFDVGGELHHRLIEPDAWNLYRDVFSPDTLDSFRELLRDVSAALAAGKRESPYSSIEYGVPRFAQYPSVQSALDSLFAHTVILMRPAQERLQLQGGYLPNPMVDTRDDLIDCLRRRRANIESILLQTPGFADSLLAVDTADKVAAVVAASDGWHQLERQAMASALDLATKEKRRGLILWLPEALLRATMLPALMSRLAALNIETTITQSAEDTANELLRWLSA